MEYDIQKLMELSKPKAIGKCFYCPEQVLAAPGQAIRWISVTTDQKRSYPTHKKCRKQFA